MAEFIIYCDESESKGRIFSNFYGGALVRSEDLEATKSILQQKKGDLKLSNEVKWHNITKMNYTQYIALMDLFFDLIKDDKVKVRVMFTQNVRRPKKLTGEQRRNQYSILYYFFIRHAFGLIYSPPYEGGVSLRIYPDRLPISAEQVAGFKGLTVALNNRSEFRKLGLRFDMENITEVESHEHIILQCLDVVVGSMNFRLNKKHKNKSPGTRMRPEKTRAKERVYQQINKRIRDIYPGFNIGITTGHNGDRSNRWNHSYRHWNFQTNPAWR